MDISPCASFPSRPGRRFSSSAPKVWLQNSISAAASRQNRRGITIDEFSGMPFFASMAPPNERNLADPGILDRALFTLFSAFVQRGKDRCYARGSVWQPPLDAGRIKHYAGPKRVGFLINPGWSAKP